MKQTLVKRVTFAPHVPGQQRIFVMLAAKGWSTLSDWCRSTAARLNDPRFTQSNASRAIYSFRPGSDVSELILNQMAVDLDISRRRLDQLCADDGDGGVARGRNRRAGVL